jgi:hypothetical protein
LAIFAAIPSRFIFAEQFGRLPYSSRAVRATKALDGCASAQCSHVNVRDSVLIEINAEEIVRKIERPRQ